MSVSGRELGGTDMMLSFFLPGGILSAVLMSVFVLSRPSRKPVRHRPDYAKISQLERQLGIGAVPPGSEFGLDELGFPVFKAKPRPVVEPTWTADLYMPVPLPDYRVPRTPDMPLFVNQTYPWCHDCGSVNAAAHASWCPKSHRPPPPVLAKPDHPCSLCIPGRPSSICPFNSVCQK